MRKRRMRACVDCGAPCHHNAYRCSTCRTAERRAVRTATSKKCVECGRPCHHSSYRCRPCALTERASFAALTPKANDPARKRAAVIRAERIELVEDYLLCGIDPKRIAADFGISCESLARSMRRAGRDDLANRVHVARYRDYRSKHKKCPDCGIEITDRASTCDPCQRRRQAIQRWAAA